MTVLEDGTNHGANMVTTFAAAVDLTALNWVVFGYLLTGTTGNTDGVAQVYYGTETGSIVWVVCPEVGYRILNGLDTLKY